MYLLADSSSWTAEESAVFVRAFFPVALTIGAFVLTVIYLLICANYGQFLVPDLSKLLPTITIVRPTAKYCLRCGGETIEKSAPKAKGSR